MSIQVSCDVCGEHMVRRGAPDFGDTTIIRAGDNQLSIRVELVFKPSRENADVCWNCLRGAVAQVMGILEGVAP